MSFEDAEVCRWEVGIDIVRQPIALGEWERQKEG
jgi:hypothetical protein